MIEYLFILLIVGTAVPTVGMPVLGILFHKFF